MDPAQKVALYLGLKSSEVSLIRCLQVFIRPKKPFDMVLNSSTIFWSSGLCLSYLSATSLHLANCCWGGHSHFDGRSRADSSVGDVRKPACFVRYWRNWKGIATLNIRETHHFSSRWRQGKVGTLSWLIDIFLSRWRSSAYSHLGYGQLFLKRRPWFREPPCTDIAVRTMYTNWSVNSSRALVD